MRQTFRILAVLLGGLLTVFSAFAQVTTSGLSGHVIDENKEPLAGAAIVAVHVPSGTQYAAVANEHGRFVINGMRAGGPYSVEISFLGMGTLQYKDLTLALGEPYTIDAVMKVSNELDAVVLTAEGSFNSSKTGAASNFSQTAVESMPTIDRSIYDIVKFSPQASLNKDGGISFAGSNNRYNSFQIDGAVANDSFGLASSGTNGGQTGANPISLDAIEEVQVVIAPFDVRQSGFTGGAINAITKSGTNQVKGSVYGYFNNQDFIGKTPGPDVENRKKYDAQNTQTYGFTIGAPIVKNKLFIFASAEYYRKSYPNVYTPANNSYEIEKLKLNAPVEIDGVEHEYFDSAVAQAVIDRYNEIYHKGSPVKESFGQHQVNDQSINGMLRLDWNINDRNKLMVRYQFMDAYKDRYSAGASSYYFNNSSYKMSNMTNTIVLELNSRPSDKVSNEFRATAVLVRDKRSVPYNGANMYIKDKVYVNIGTEYSSGANSMDSDTYTISDNVSIFAGNHNITVGTHNEIYRFNNLFLQYAFGGYTYKSLADFFAGKVDQFNFRYADPTMPGVDGPRWKATTYAAQFGLYVQDEWRPNRDFTLTYGLRMDIPTLLNKPTANDKFNESELSASTGEKVGVTPKATPLFSPRIGFRWWMDKNHKALLRGGAGLFTGRVPFVWLSNAYNNTGMEAKSITVNRPSADFPHTSDPYNDIVLAGKAEAGGKATINTLNRHFKYPQVFRVNLGYDHDLGCGWSITLDALYSKNINNVFFRNLALSPSGANAFAVDAETAAANPNSIASQYNVNKDYYAVVALENTNMGYSYSLSAMVNKHFNFGLELMASYTFGHSYSVNDGASSIAMSNWQNYLSLDASRPTLSYSVFDRPHKVMGVISYTSPMYGRILKTTVSLSYTGQSGARYSFVAKESADFNGDEFTKNGVLAYIPTEEELVKMNWATPQDALSYENFIRGDRYLSKHRGQYAERFGALYPFEHHFDLHVAEDFYYDRKHNRKISIFVDFLNISNLFNREWGMYYSSGWRRQLLEITDVKKDAKGNATATYKFAPYDVEFSDFSSRWRCQLGLRLTF